MLASVVRHRLDDLENPATSDSVVNQVRHRLDDLENS